MKALLVISILLLNIYKLVACSCINNWSTTKAYKQTEVIFHGKVIKKSFVSIESTMTRKKIESLQNKYCDIPKVLEELKYDAIIEVQLEILKVYKGKINADTIKVYTSRSGASCGYTSFKEDEVFIIYASTKGDYFIFSDIEKENTLWTNHCTRTTKFNASEANKLDLLIKN